MQERLFSSVLLFVLKICYVFQHDGSKSGTNFKHLSYLARITYLMIEMYHSFHQTKHYYPNTATVSVGFIKVYSIMERTEMMLAL